jgi:hypothetical protein
VKSLLAAETAILVELKTIRVILLVLKSIIVSLLAFCAGQCDLYTHGWILLRLITSKQAPANGAPAIR